MRKTLILSAVALAALMTACAPIPQLPDAAQPIAPGQAGLVAAATHGEFSAKIDAEWWTAFKDPQLDALEQRALAESPSLTAARARIARAAAGVEGAGAADKPTFNAAFDDTRELISKNGIFPPPLGGETLTLANLQAGVSYDWDFFGRHAADLNAALGQQRAAEADAAAARLMISSQVAHAYLELARTLAQAELIKQQIGDREQSLALIKQRVTAGLDNQTDQRSAEAPLPELQRQATQLAAQAELLRHQLASLSVQPSLALAGLAPQLPQALSMGSDDALTLDLLGRRPDVVAARWRVEAATQDVRSARTQFYPNVTLSAFGGYNAVGLDNLLNGKSVQWGFGPSIHLPLFDMGRLRSQLKGAAANADGAVASYNGAVLAAVRDASDQFVTLQSLGKQQPQVEAQLGNARATLSLAQQRFDAGLSNRLAVLAAQGNLLAQQRQAIDLQSLTLEGQVNLMRALGGGWNESTTAVAAAK